MKDSVNAGIKVSIVGRDKNGSFPPVFFSYVPDMLDYIDMLTNEGYQWSYRIHAVTVEYDK